VRAKRLLGNLARRLRDDHPSAASALDEGLDETLTVMRLRLPKKLERVLCTTKPWRISSAPCAASAVV
jgi:putative transposase